MELRLLLAPKFRRVASASFSVVYDFGARSPHEHARSPFLCGIPTWGASTCGRRDKRRTLSNGQVTLDNRRGSDRAQ